jgi:hypothetical protein
VGYQPTLAQANYLTGVGRRIHWIAPDGKCIYGSLAFVARTTTELAIARTKRAVLLGSRSITPLLEAAALQLHKSVDKVQTQIVTAITNNDWANPHVGDYIVDIAAAVLGVGVTILMPAGNLVPINGGGALIVKVTNPTEHYHATERV